MKAIKLIVIAAFLQMTILLVGKNLFDTNLNHFNLVTLSLSLTFVLFALTLLRKTIEAEQKLNYKRVR